MKLNLFLFFNVNINQVCQKTESEIYFFCYFFFNAFFDTVVKKIERLFFMIRLYKWINISASVL